MSHGASLGNGQPAYPYVLDEQYVFDEAGRRYLPSSSSTTHNYYYSTVPISSQGSQAPRPTHHQRHSSNQQPYQTQDPRFIAQQTNQTLTALASARRQPPEYRGDPNAQVVDPGRGGHPYHCTPRDYHPPTSATHPSSGLYTPVTQSPHGIVRTPSLTPPNPQILSPILKTSDGHACSYCGKTFGRPSAVKIHMAIHTGERAFTCPAPGCHRSFSVRSNMSRHIRNVHQSWPYENDGDLDSGNEGAEEIDDRERY